MLKLSDARNVLFEHIFLIDPSDQYGSERKELSLQKLGPTFCSSVYHYARNQLLAIAFPPFFGYAAELFYSLTDPIFKTSRNETSDSSRIAQLSQSDP